MASVVAGGFVRFPPPSVRRLRRRCRRRSSSRETAGIEFHGSSSPSAGAVIGTNDRETYARRALVVTSRRREAIFKRTPLCGRSAVARLPSWASCDNSASDPWTSLPPQLPIVGGPSSSSSAGASLDDHVGIEAQKLYCEVDTTSLSGGTGAAASPLRAEERGSARAAAQLEDRKDWETSSATTIAATVPRVLTHDPHAPLAQTATGPDQGPTSSNISSRSSLASAWGAIHLNGSGGGGGDAGPYGAAGMSASLAPEKEQEAARPLPSPKRPENSKGKATTAGRPAGAGCARGGEGRGRRGGVATIKNFPPSSPWRSPRVVRCMRRPEQPAGRGPFVQQRLA